MVLSYISFLFYAILDVISFFFSFIEKQFSNYL